MPAWFWWWAGIMLTAFFFGMNAIPRAVFAWSAEAGINPYLIAFVLGGLYGLIPPIMVWRRR